MCYLKLIPLKIFFYKTIDMQFIYLWFVYLFLALY